MTTIDVILDNFFGLTQETEIFLDCDNSLQNKFKNDLKHMYDFSKTEEIEIRSSDALPELLIKNFDNEQIWQELELQNDKLLTVSLNNVSKLLVSKENLIFSNLQNEMNEIKNKSEDNDDEISLELTNQEHSDDGNDDAISENMEDTNEHEHSDDELSIESLNNENSKPQKKKSEVEDDFFKLDEMEKFLKLQEQKMNDSDSGNNSEKSEDSEEENVDLFEDNSDEEDEKSKTARFKDFFKQTEESKEPKRNKFLEDTSEQDDEEEQEVQHKSSLEIRDERLKKKIGHLEKAAVSEKPWPLKGEIKADSRPVNSLLEEVLEFDLTSRPAPVITEETSLQLEDIIKQRIKDKVFDSVERKAKPVKTPIEFKKKLVLDQEKSKQSLAQIYEKEYVEQQAALDPDNQDKDEEEIQLHKDIKTMMRDLFNKLDALSNFHFTPKPAIPELRIINNMPAISIEEVAPVTASDAALLAPEEVRNKTKGDIVGKSERTASDKKRERRKKKAKVKAHLKNLAINKNMLGNTINLTSKKDSEKKLKNKNSEKVDENIITKNFKSSRAFFTELQDQVHSHIGEKLQTKKRKKSEVKLEAKKMKL